MTNIIMKGIKNINNKQIHLKDNNNIDRMRVIYYVYDIIIKL
jgi:hypothetical protein